MKMSANKSWKIYLIQVWLLLTQDIMKMRYRNLMIVFKKEMNIMGKDGFNKDIHIIIWL